MTFSDAAEKVLETFGQRQPMGYREITRLALKHRFIETSGLTPWQTMSTAIHDDIRQREKRDEPPRFFKHERGVFGLAAWLEADMLRHIRENNREIQTALLERCRALSPQRFETLVGELLAAIGFDEVEVTPDSKDGGIDVTATLIIADVVRIHVAVQAKRWANNVHTPTVQQLYGALGSEAFQGKHQQGLIVTTSGFSDGAAREAKRLGIALMDGEHLAALLAEYRIGADRYSHPVLFLKEDTEWTGTAD